MKYNVREVEWENIPELVKAKAQFKEATILGLRQKLYWLYEKQQKLREEIRETSITLIRIKKEKNE